jgi:diguanylate cyclase (GGDEF)-like protein
VRDLALGFEPESEVPHSVRDDGGAFGMTLCDPDRPNGMELLMWRWSTGVQVASALMIAVFFLALRRTGDAPTLRWWVAAWAANLAAMGVTVAFWVLQPPEPWMSLVRAAYLGAKTGFVLLVVQGAWALRRPGASLLRPAVVAAGTGGAAVAGMFLLTSVPLVGVGQAGTIALAFGACAAALVRRAPTTAVTGWLAGGLAIRALLGVAEAGAYLVRHLRPEVASGLDTSLGVFLAAHSSLDTGAEWLLALGCVLALAERSHAELRRLADRDALTGLASRRALPGLLRDAARDGATLVFFDLDDFKGINDRLGHLVGDDHLARFAAALESAFPPPHAVVRYAGDEFLVIARGTDAAGLETSLARVGASGIAHSAGVAALAAGGDPGEALRRADEAMYAAKGARRAA